MKRTKKTFRIYAVMTDAELWINRSGMVSAFDTKAQAVDELRDLRCEGEQWWIQRGTITLESAKVKS